MARYEVKIGDEFDVAGIEIEAVDDVERLVGLDERRQSFRHQVRLSYLVLAAFFIAEAVAALLGWKDGTYNELATVTAYGGPWAALVVGRYFKGSAMPNG
jgi:hypothetical protein